VTRRRALLDEAVVFAGPAGLILLVGLLGAASEAGTREDVITALVAVAIVVSLHVFIGNSGVISFGHISFVAIGAFAAGVMTIPAAIKPTLLPDLFPVLADNEIGSGVSLLLAAAVGGIFAFLAGIPLMRLSGLAAGIATFAVLEITHNVLRFWEKVGPGAKTLSLVPETTDVAEATAGALAVVAIAFLYSRSRAGRKLRASREDMLVIGGASSLLGAVLGALLISFLDSFLLDAENGTEVLVAEVTLPNGSSTVILGLLMALVLIVRPSGITGGRELRLPGPRRGRPAGQPAEDEVVA
jgi:branched-chain amino acid transport system permease protein